MNTPKITIGLDLGDGHHHVCVLDAAGEILAQEVIVNTREVLTAFCARYPSATLVMETGTHSPWVSHLVAGLGYPVIVANARKLRAISQSQTKSDREDAQMLARLGRADPKLLSPVRHRSETTQRALVRLKVREALVRSSRRPTLPRWLRSSPPSPSSRPKSNPSTPNSRPSPSNAIPRPHGCDRSRASARSPRSASS